MWSVAAGDLETNISVHRAGGTHTARARGGHEATWNSKGPRATHLRFPACLSAFPGLLSISRTAVEFTE